MIKSMPYFLLLFISIFIAPACTSTSPVAITPNKINTATSSPNFTGLWGLNKELSQSPQDQLKENIKKPKNSQRNQNKNNRGTGQHGGSGRGRGNGQGSNDADNKQKNTRRGHLPQSLLAFLKSSETLSIQHEEPLLILASPDDQEHIYTDFRSTHVSSNKNPNQKITIAGWENNILIIESTLNTGRIIQHFDLKAASKQLWINTEILTPYLPKPVKFNRVYELIKAASE